MVTRLARRAMRVAAQGKSFLLDGSPFRFRGVRHRVGLVPAEPGSDEARGVSLDLDAINAAGFTVVCLPPPTPWAVDRAASSGLRFMLEIDDADLLVPAASRRERRRVVRELGARVRRSMRAWDGSEALLGVVVGSCSPPSRSQADAEIAQRMANEVAIALHNLDAGLLAARRAAWPRDGECPAEFDFLIAECRLAGWDELLPALLDCHGDLGDRPLVLGEVSLSGQGHAQSPDARWVSDSALRCGIAGTIEQRWSPGENSENAGIRRRTVRDLELDWPSISIVINAYNAEVTLDECLEHCERLEYPELEVIVVDDGSTDATAKIADAHDRARLLAIPHSGLAAGRNAGYRAAHGDLIVYLDADAYPSPEWPWYIALGALGDRVCGCGGPNAPPSDEPVSARVVACSPGGPVPHLLGPDRAEYLPGCNLAFWRQVLEQHGGFDPIFDAAADDIEFEWRLAESGYELAYHPAALVWHHRRPGLAPYLRQQRQYGRSQAILERRCPHRFPVGHRLRRASERLRARISGGESGASYPVRYLTLPRGEDAILELAHQWGMPAAIVLGATAPLVLLRRSLAAPALTATAFVGTLFAIDVAVAGQGRRSSERRLGFRARVAAFRLLRPLAFRWGHLSGRRELRAAVPHWPPRPAMTAAAPGPARPGQGDS